MEHAMQIIAQAAARPVGKAKDRRSSEAHEGVRFARDVIAVVEGDNDSWLSRGMRLVEGTKHFRAAALEVWADYRDEMRQHAKSGTGDKGKAARVEASANTRLAEMSAIASAFNAGASLNGLATYVEGLPSHPTLNYGHIVAYARTFSQSKAGRPVNSTLQNLVGFIVREGKRDNLTPEDKRVLESLTQWAQGQGEKFE